MDFEKEKKQRGKLTRDVTGFATNILAKGLHHALYARA